MIELDEAVFAMAGRRMASQRKALHLTQEVVAELVGLGPRTYNQIENGARTSLDSLVRIAETLGMSMDKLLGTGSTEAEDPRLEMLLLSLNKEEKERALGILELVFPR